MSETPNTPTPETITDEQFDKFLEQGQKLAQIGAVDVTRPVAAQLTAALQTKIAVLLPQQTAAAARAAQDRAKAAAARDTETNHRLWQAIHTRPRSDLWTPGQSDLPFLQDLVSKVPGCPRCRANATKYLQTNPPDVATRESYFAWTVGFHNSASLDAGHAPYTLEQALAAWPA